MTAWILSLMLALAPPAKLAALPSFPGWHETAEQRTARYMSIAEDIAAVTTSPREMAVLVAISFHESGWAPDVDKGPCWRGPSNDGPRCDGGRSATIFQLQAAGDEDARFLFSHRREAAKRALSAMRRSAKRCVPQYGADAALRAYASGACQGGIVESKAMVNLARRLLRDHPPPKSP